MTVWQFPWARSNEHRQYGLLGEGDSISPTSEDSRPSPERGLWSSRRILLVITLCFTSSLAGFMVRGWLDSFQGPPSYPLNPVLSTVIKTFEFNEIYSAAPGNRSNQAWADNLPFGKGFMTGHSQISNISEFSVFHQLHCIDTLRHAYYAALRTQNTTTSGHGEHQAKRNHRHVIHCFDFLRQCVECSADTNVEPVDWTVGGVTGWGFERICRDFASLKRYVEKWRVPGIV